MMSDIADTVGEEFAEVTSTLLDLIARLRVDMIQPDTSIGRKEYAKNAISRINDAIAALNNVG